MLLVLSRQLMGAAEQHNSAKSPAGDGGTRHGATAGAGARNSTSKGRASAEQRVGADDAAKAHAAQARAGACKAKFMLSPRLSES